MKYPMKSSKPKLVAKDIHVQSLLPVAGIVQDVQSALFGLCVGAGKARHLRLQRMLEQPQLRE